MSTPRSARLSPDPQTVGVTLFRLTLKGPETDRSSRFDAAHEGVLP